MKIKRLTALFCAVAMLLTSCAGGAPEPAGEQAAPQAKGRYLETELSFPPEAARIYDMRQDETGALELFAFLVNGQGWGSFRSEDGGRTWKKQKDPAWMASFTGKEEIYQAFYLEDGGIYLEFVDEEEVTECLYDGAGNLIQLKGRSSQSGPGVNGIKRADNGDLVFCNYFALYQTGADGTPVHTYEIDGLSAQGGFVMTESTLVAATASTICFYDLESGELTEEIPQSLLNQGERVGVFTDTSLSQTSRLLSLSQDKDAFYYCDASGIYRRIIGGNVSERLVDGDLSSLAMPTVMLHRLFSMPDGDFLVWAYNDKTPILLRYHYDKEAPAAPTTELRLYALQENRTVRQAIGMFQRQNPDIKVTYEVGMSDSETEPADALRTFNTRLLAGDGPDVIVLDGMPVDSYIEKGALADLSAAQEETVNALLPNVAGAYRRNGKLYALPGRITVPMMALHADVAKSVSDLSSLTGWLEQQPDAQLYCTAPDVLLRMFFPLLAPGWFRDDGSLDKEAFSRSLEQVYRISQLRGARNKTANEQKTLDLEFGAVAFSGGGLSADIGPLRKMRDAAAVDEALKELGGGVFLPLAGERGPVFSPMAVLGVNAAAKQPELAQAFVSFALSAPVLEYDLNDGLPANREALRQNMQSPYSQEDLTRDNSGTYYSMGVETGKETDGEPEFVSYEMRVLWPSEAFLEALLAGLEQIKTPSTVNEVVMQMVVDETEAYFTGSQTLEETTDAFDKKITLYLAEMA